jgi:hypothetical protein
VRCTADTLLSTHIPWGLHKSPFTGSGGATVFSQQLRVLCQVKPIRDKHLFQGLWKMMFVSYSKWFHENKSYLESILTKILKRRRPWSETWDSALVRCSQVRRDYQSANCTWSSETPQYSAKSVYTESKGDILRPMQSWCHKSHGKAKATHIT